MRCKADSMGESVTDAIWVAAESMGYSELRRLQETAVRAFVTGTRDVFVSIPTSGGKSLCYSVLLGVSNILWGGQATVLGEHAILSWDAMLRVGETQRSANYWLVTIT